MSVIVVTGGSRGIGASVALDCARRGMGVILTYHKNSEAAAKVAQDIEAQGGQAVALPLGVAPYASMKGGLEVLTRYMAKEFGERGIRANTVSPGAIRTELGGGLTPEFEAQLASQTALGRIGEPEEVARLISHLLSSESGWINAQSIEVAGGYLV